MWCTCYESVFGLRWEGGQCGKEEGREEGGGERGGEGGGEGLRREKGQGRYVNELLDTGK